MAYVLLVWLSWLFSMASKYVVLFCWVNQASSRQNNSSDAAHVRWIALGNVTRTEREPAHHLASFHDPDVVDRDHERDVWQLELSDGKHERLAIERTWFATSDGSLTRAQFMSLWWHQRHLHVRIWHIITKGEQHRRYARRRLAVSWNQVQ